MPTVSDDEYRALIEQEAAILDLTKHPGWAILVDWLELRMKPKKLAILNGRAATFEKYLEDAFFCVGATAALDAPHDVAQLAENERERRTELNQRSSE